MLRTIALLLIGAVPAAAVTYAVLFPSRETASAGPLGTESETDPASLSASAANGDRAARRASGTPSTVASSIFAATATIDDANGLEAQLAYALAEPYSQARDAEIDALFARFASLDLRRAVRFAERPGFDVELVGAVFRAWAEQDAAEALQRLAAIESPRIQQVAAVAVLEALGTDAVERIAAALPDYRRIGFQGEALARRARTDPQGALAAALSFGDPAARNNAAQRVGMAWVHDDPVAAYTRAASLPPELQAEYRASVASEWVHLDTAGFLTFADSQPTLTDLLPAMMSAMALDSERIFAIAGRHPPLGVGEGFGPNITVERTAFSAIVQQDPQHALSLVNAMPEGQRRDVLLVAYAETHGRTSPDEAMAWVRSLNPPAPELEATVIWSSALQDIDKALRWFAAYEPQGAPVTANGALLASPAVIAANIAVFAAAHPRRAEIADQLRARRDDASAQAVLSRMTATWVQTDPSGALDWLLSSESGVEPALVANAAARLASRDARAAAAYIDRMPPELRGTWFERVALPYAAQDPQGAVDWIARFQGEPEYDRVMQRVVQVAAQSDPLDAARMLSIAPGDVQRSSAPGIAVAWARESLSGAARWAADLSDPAARNAAVSQVAGIWAARDARAAQVWAANLAAGETRDSALSVVLSRIVRDGYEVDRAFMRAFGSDQARQQAVLSSVPLLAARDPERARSLIDAYVNDSALRRQANELLERVGR